MGKRKISNVWTFFTRSTDRTLAKCCKCKKEYRNSGNTSNLKDHLKRMHPKIQSTIVESDDEDTQSSHSISTYFKKQNVYDRDSNRKKEIDKALILMVCKDFQPFSIVEDTGFQNLVKILDPRYVLPSRPTLRDSLLKQNYEICKEKLFALLQNVCHVSLTCDLWSSRANESFLTVTCHFIDKDYKMHCTVLSTNKMDINYTSENIATEINLIIKDWDIVSKVVTIVTDNASSMIKACQILKIRHLPCFAHTLNLVVQDSLKLKEVDHVIKKCKSLVTYFKSSNIATHKLITEQENQNKKPLKVIQEVPTMWNSMYHMIKRILELKNDITIVLLRMPNAPTVLNLEDSLVLQDLIEILSCFDDATKKVSGNYVTISLIIPLVYGIYNHLINLQPSTSEGKSILQKTVESVTTRLFNYEEQTRIAEKSKNRTVTANSIIYLKEYMERPNTNNDMDSLIFWNINNDSLGTIPTCAKKILCVPATSVPSERIFSKAGIVVSDRRSRLKAKNLNMLIFINQNDWLL
ncbi:E3 SUMO-protein ligase ZBED1-like [Metopolophium dirhodum]|uniref:E3 SUMO-protein ligase ZBED1-like n=1 Tax=Metopolophium dirhodum TaxID=44670 RepID=UPI002990297C|nr:E3 SUMO-protein ligase ZBED1-like [Metopolophium dirhodum]